MTKKDYVRIAAAVRNARSDVLSTPRYETMTQEERDGTRWMHSAIVSALCNALMADNPNFDADRFREAC